MSDYEAYVKQNDGLIRRVNKLKGIIRDIVEALENRESGTIMHSRAPTLREALIAARIEIGTPT